MPVVTWVTENGVLRRGAHTDSAGVVFLTCGSQERRCPPPGSGRLGPCGRGDAFRPDCLRVDSREEPGLRVGLIGDGRAAVMAGVFGPGPACSSS